MDEVLDEETGGIPQPFPMDYELLNKGDVIDAATIADITRTRVGTDAFSFASMGLRVRIERDTADLGAPLLLRHDKDTLVVMTDEEAAEHRRRVYDRKMLGMFRAYRDLQRVDVANLPEDARKLHDRAVETRGAILQGVISARREIRAQAARRMLPGREAMG